jgi:hypothetical protein
LTFTSPEYIVFCLLFFPVYFLVRGTWRWLWILVSSYAFYAADQPRD